MNQLPPNPFADVDVSGLARLAEFERKFAKSLGEPLGWGEAQLGVCLVSAIINGGLVSPRTWQPWLDALISGKLRGVNGSFSILFSVPTTIEKPRTLRRRWFADPVTTALLLQKLTVQKARASRGHAVSAQLAIEQFRLAIGLDGEAYDEFLAWFRPAVALKLRLRVPAVLAEHALLIGESCAPNREIWNALVTETSPEDFAAQSQASFLNSLPDASSRSSTSTKKIDYEEIDQRHFKALYYSILKKLPKTPKGGYETGNRMSNAAAVRDGVAALNKGIVSGPPSNVREAVIFLFYRLSSTKPADKGPALGIVMLGTVINYIRAFARADWGSVWMLDFETCEPTALWATFSDVIENGVKGNDKSAYGAVRALDRYICYHWPRIKSCWDFVTADSVRAVRNPAVELISEHQFAQLRALLLHHPAGPRDAAMTRLASILMFRAGLRGQEEARYLRIGDIERFENHVQLIVRTNGNVATKTRTSYRRLPLDVLLGPDDLAELLEWRARRIVECRGRISDQRLFDDAGGKGDGLTQARLLVPIEHAVAMVMGESPTDRCKFRNWTLGGALRHSFCSYVLATLLLPDDAGALALPRRIGPKLVSLERKRLLAGPLMGDGRLGQTAVHAVSTLMGHAHVSRLLNVYAHLVDWSLAAYLWRWSGQPSMPAETVQRLLGGANEERPPSLHSIRKTSQRRCLEESAHLATLRRRDGKGFVHTAPPPRLRAGSGRRSEGDDVIGGAFIDHFQDHLTGDPRLKGRPWKPEKVDFAFAPPPIRLLENRLQQIDAVMNLARSGVAAPEIAELLLLDGQLCRTWLASAAHLAQQKRGAQYRFPPLLQLLPASSVSRMGRNAQIARLPDSFQKGLDVVDDDADARNALIRFLASAQAGSVGFRVEARARAYHDAMIRVGVPVDMITIQRKSARAGTLGVATTDDLSGRRIEVRIGATAHSGTAKAEFRSILYGLALVAIGSRKIGLSKLQDPAVTKEFEVEIVPRGRRRVAPAGGGYAGKPRASDARSKKPSSKTE